jgi:hypothetical protein
MGGDPGRIRVLNDRLAFDDDGLEMLRKELDEFEPEAIFIDPWVSFVPTDTRIKDSNAIRALLDKIERAFSPHLRPTLGRACIPGASS